MTRNIRKSRDLKHKKFKKAIKKQSQTKQKIKASFGFAILF
jgi:hypothetical protein